VGSCRLTRETNGLMAEKEQRLKAKAAADSKGINQRCLFQLVSRPSTHLELCFRRVNRSLGGTALECPELTVELLKRALREDAAFGNFPSR
jgi:hypothetical protein